MTIELNDPQSKSQPVFQMINSDSYSSEDDGNEFYESKNSFESSSQEQLFSIFEPRTQENSSTIDEQMSNTAQARFEPIKNNNLRTEAETVTTAHTQEESTTETHLTLDEAIAELEAQKSQSLSCNASPMLVQEANASPTLIHSSPEFIQEESSNNEVYIPQIADSCQSSSHSPCSSSSSVHNNDEFQAIASQKNSPDLIDMASSPNLNEKEQSLKSASLNEKEKPLESVSLNEKEQSLELASLNEKEQSLESASLNEKENPLESVSLNEKDKTLESASPNEKEKSLKSVSSNVDPSTPELLNDEESIEKQKEVYEDTEELKHDSKDSSDENDESELEEEEEEKEQQLFEIKNFIADEETMTPVESVFSHRVGKAETIEIPESELVHQELTGPIEVPPTTAGEKANTRTFHFKRVRLFYNKVILKCHSAKTWISVVFKRQPKQKEEKLQPKSKSAENVATTRIETSENQRVSRSVETFTEYTASVNIIEEISASSLLPDIITPIYNTQKKTELTIETENKPVDKPTGDISAAVFDIMQLCEESFYGV